MKRFLVILFFIFPINICFGENDIISETGSIDNNICIENKYDLVGDYDVKINTNLIYSIKNNFTLQKSESLYISYILSKNGEKISEKTGEKFSVSFIEPGIINIKVNILEKDTNCKYNFEKNLHIYSKVVSYISDKNDINLSFDDDFQKNDIFLNKIYLENKNSNSMEDVFLSTIIDNLYFFEDSDILIINSDYYLQILQGFEKTKNIYNINFSDKKIFIVTKSSFILSKKILGNFINDLDINVYTFSPDNLLNFLNYISLGKSSLDLIKDKTYGVMQISFNNSGNNFLFLTNIINKLISSGFPITILGIIFSIGVAVTAINFIRQFIGISIFNLYYPIFIALSIYIFSFKLTIILFISSLISIYLLKYLYKKTQFLLNTKLSLFFILYIIISILLLGFLSLFNYLDFLIIKTNLIIFPFIIIPMIVYKLFSDERKLFTLGFLFYLSEFIFVTFTAYILIKSNFIQSLFLAYTELLLIIFLLNFLIGKFSGLHILEYIRFIPLIKKHFQEEE